MKHGIALFGVAACLASIATATEAPTPRAINFADRVAAQTAIEQVYWDHRIWPKENTGPKPALEGVMSSAEMK